MSDQPAEDLYELRTTSTVRRALGEVLPEAVAAAAYEYDNDARWVDYWSNILIPPHMASRPEVVEHYKRKFYQRYVVRTLFYTLEFAFQVSVV